MEKVGDIQVVDEWEQHNRKAALGDAAGHRLAVANAEISALRIQVSRQAARIAKLEELGPLIEMACLAGARLGITRACSPEEQEALGVINSIKSQAKAILNGAAPDAP